MKVSLGMKKIVLGVGALAEVGTGLLLLVSPLLVVRLLFGFEVSDLGVIMSRLAGAALIGLGVSCWPANPSNQQIYGMLTYSTVAMLYLIRIAIRGAPEGPHLWPGVVAHAIIVVLLVWARRKEQKPAIGM